MLEGPANEGLDTRELLGGGGGPIDDFVAALGRAFVAADGRERPLMDDRLEEIGVELVESCFVGDFVGDLTVRGVEAFGAGDGLAELTLCLLILDVDKVLCRFNPVLLEAIPL